MASSAWLCSRARRIASSSVTRSVGFGAAALAGGVVGASTGFWLHALVGRTPTGAAHAIPFLILILLGNSLRAGNCSITQSSSPQASLLQALRWIRRRRMDQVMRHARMVRVFLEQRLEDPNRFLQVVHGVDVFLRQRHE